MKIIPLDNRILVLPLEEKDSGILKAETKDKKRPEKGTIYATGKDYKGELKKGDLVYYQKFTVEEIEFNKKIYYVGLPEDFFCVVK